MPVFVGEEISICCRPAVEMQKPEIQVDDSTRQQPYLEGKMQWELWVQKSVNGLPSMCVKATASVIWRRPGSSVSPQDCQESIFSEKLQRDMQYKHRRGPGIRRMASTHRARFIGPLGSPDAGR